MSGVRFQRQRGWKYWKFDIPPPGRHDRQHEQIPTTTAPEGHRDESRFEQAAQALAGASADAGGSLAPSQVRQLIGWAKAAQCLIAESEFEALPLVSDETGVLGGIQLHAQKAALEIFAREIMPTFRGR